ncbi:putative universal stress protein [Erysiphe necator]|uniref:Putative universal stress protein n=1 Tax=Uncinula necator TaxID=52586 RepID=A0A0B1P619_UNCNE|nr:putative universal stress protein [Erysiphe necator]
MTHKPQSLESVLDEERRHVLALIEEARIRASSDSARSENGAQPVRSMLQFDLPIPSNRNSTSTSSIGESMPLITPVRSMLDINPVISPIKNTSSMPDLNASKFITTSYRSMLDVSPTGRSPLSFDARSDISPRALPVRSMLDVSPMVQNYLVSSTRNRSTSPRSSSSRCAFDFSPNTMLSLSSSENSYKSQFTRTPLSQREFSPTASRNNSYTRKFSSSMSNADYEFTNNLSSYLPSDASRPLTPKRSAQAGKRSSTPSAMMDAVKNEYFSFKDWDKHRTGSKNGMINNKSPHGRFSKRSITPKFSESAKILIKEEIIDKPRRLQRRRSDANLISSSGVKLSLPKVRRRTFNGTTTLPNDSRLPKETTISEVENAIVVSSDDSVSDDETVQRGRNVKNKSTHEGYKVSDRSERDKESNNAFDFDSFVNKESKDTEKKLSLETENELSSRSEVTTKDPSETLLLAKKLNDLLKMSSDECDSRSNTSYDSETEAGISDIKHAQKLPINTTACISTPATNRCVRSIHRGDFIKMQQEARNNQRRIRKYLVAVDLSEEAAHALEWTIGTVLRDGDTLLAIYCADEEVGISTNDSSLDNITQEHITGNAISNIKSTIPLSTQIEPLRPQSYQAPGSRTSSTTENIDRNPEKNKAEQQRRKAVQEITDKVSKFLRRTNLQVKVVIEVIHCKNPKHLITEVIDFVSPTLVILGSRGRSALKGFILGSFSNYIVTKSSVPVMVARKRLCNASKYKRPSIRLANNIENPHQATDSRTLAAAKIE